MLKKRITYFYMRNAARLGHRFSSNWYKTLGGFERPTCEQMNIVAIPIEKKVDTPSNFVLPSDIMFALIDKAASTGIIHKCTCRTSARCSDYPRDIGCVVLGPTVETLDPAIGRICTKDEAKAHVVKSLDTGMYPCISHYVRDAQMYSLDYAKLLILCFCCECCCTMRNTAKETTDMDNSFFSNTHRLPFVTVSVDESKCNGCEECADVCFVEAISFEDGKAKIDQDKCKGCGKCALVCDALSVGFETDDVDAILGQMHTTSDIS